MVQYDNIHYQGKVPWASHLRSKKKLHRSLRIYPSLECRNSSVPGLDRRSRRIVFVIHTLYRTMEHRISAQVRNGCRLLIVYHTNFTGNIRGKSIKCCFFPPFPHQLRLPVLFRTSTSTSRPIANTMMFIKAIIALSLAAMALGTSRGGTSCVNPCPLIISL